MITKLKNGILDEMITKANTRSVFVFITISHFPSEADGREKCKRKLIDFDLGLKFSVVGGRLEEKSRMHLWLTAFDINTDWISTNFSFFFHFSRRFPRDSTDMRGENNFVARWHDIHCGFHSTAPAPSPYIASQKVEIFQTQSIYIKYLILTDFKTINPSIYAKSLVIVLSQD